MADFRAISEAGRRLAELHIGYENVEPWPLEWVYTEDVRLSWRVEKMRLSKDKTELVVNPSLTLAEIPPEAFEYRLGNRSALEWVIDQYQVSTDKRSGIVTDPNRDDDPEAIVGLVVRVSVETVAIVKGMPS
jgi:predicted helicase